MKKVIVCLVALVLMIPACSYAKEKTLNQLKSEAQANRDAYAKAKAEKELSEQEKENATAEKRKVEAEIETVNANIAKLEKEIEELEKDIEVKDEEIKELMEFVQVSNGENTYMEYIFGASDFTDFIYRVSVAEQLSDYNDQLIEEYNKAIEKSEKQKKELAKKEEELAAKKQELTLLEAKLNKEINDLQHGMLSKDEEYKTQMAMINSLISRGCKGSETLTSCQDRLNRESMSSGKLVSVNGTYMPIAKGYVTSDYGWRDLDGNGSKEDYHTGIDFSRSISGDTVYPIASGQIILLTYNASCGNHIVYVKHNINNHSYVTSYWHLSSWSVKVGQYVSANTKIGSMAGRNSGDMCSGGIHVHLNLFDNANGKWESSAARGYPNSGRINPRTVAPQIPGHMAYFSHR